MPDEDGSLDDRDREILAFEKLWWKYPGAKENAIHQRWGLNATRYYQILNTLIDHPQAVVEQPVVVQPGHVLTRIALQKVPTVKVSAGEADTDGAPRPWTCPSP